jgi:hypothetical protein
MAPEAEKSPFDPNPGLVTKSDRLHFYVNVEFCGSVSGKNSGRDYRNILPYYGAF